MNFTGQALLAAALAGLAMAVPFGVEAPHPLYLTTITTTIDGKPTTITAISDPWPTVTFPPPTGTQPVVTNSCSVSVVTVDSPPATVTVTYNSPTPTVVTTTVDGKPATYTSPSPPPGCVVSPSSAGGPSPNWVTTRTTSVEGHATTLTITYDSPIPTVVTTTLPDGHATTYTSTIFPF